MVTTAMYRSDQTRADAPAAPGLQSHPQLPGPPPPHGPSSSSSLPSLQPQQVSLSSASARSSSLSSSSTSGQQPLPPLAMSIGIAPVPGIHLRGPPGPGQQQTTRTLQGPSAQDWARHRDIIVDLYRQYPLKKVSDIMRTQYNFSARYFGLPSLSLLLSMSLSTQPAPMSFLVSQSSTHSAPCQSTTVGLFVSMSCPSLNMDTTCWPTQHLHRWRHTVLSHHCTTLIYPSPSPMGASRMCWLHALPD